MLRYEETLMTEDGRYDAYIADDITHIKLSIPKEVIIKAIVESRPIKLHYEKEMLRNGTGRGELMILFKPDRED